MSWLVALCLIAVTASPAPSPGTDTRQVTDPGSPVPVLSLRGDDRRFASYDFRQADPRDVDRPMYMLHGPASSPGITDALVADKGVRRFNESCSTTRFAGHIRLYPVGGDGKERSGAARVVGTVHLDFDDKGGCSGRIHGYPDIAKQWFLEAMRAVPSWRVTPDAWNLHNGSRRYVVQRKVAGVEVPHLYGQSPLATDVYVP